MAPGEEPDAQEADRDDVTDDMTNSMTKFRVKKPLNLPEGLEIEEKSPDDKKKKV